MKDKLTALESGNSILIEIDQFQKFLDYSYAQVDYYSYRLEYTNNDMVLITLIERHTCKTIKMENLYTPDSIRTFTGIYINVFEPTLEMICIEDIAHSLANQCRFAGHLPVFYSVAQHCIKASNLADKAYKLQALLHDASEAYLLDMPSPIKKRLPDYKKIENNLMTLIAEKFGFKFPLHEKVKEIDNYMLQWEWHTLMLDKNTFPKIECLNFESAKAHFCNIYTELTGVLI